MEKGPHSSGRTKTRLVPTPYPVTSGRQRKTRDTPVGPKDIRCPKDDVETTRGRERKLIKVFLHQPIKNKTDGKTSLLTVPEDQVVEQR